MMLNHIVQKIQRDPFKIAADEKDNVKKKKHVLWNLLITSFSFGLVCDGLILWFDRSNE